MIELNNNIYEARIADLNPGQTYDVMVLSQNADGDGMFSKTLKITTKSKPKGIVLSLADSIDRC